MITNATNFDNAAVLKTYRKLGSMFRGKKFRYLKDKVRTWKRVLGITSEIDIDFTNPTDLSRVDLKQRTELMIRLKYVLAELHVRNCRLISEYTRRRNDRSHSNQTE